MCQHRQHLILRFNRLQISHKSPLRLARIKPKRRNSSNNRNNHTNLQIRVFDHLILSNCPMEANHSCSLFRPLEILFL